MNAVQVQPAQPGDAEELAPRLRPADLREIQAAVGKDPYTALEQGRLQSGPCFAALDPEGIVMALFGASPHPHRPEAGTVWLLGSTSLMRNRFGFLRAAPYWLNRLHSRYRVLGNVIDARNVLHLRWLKWLGFELGERIEKFDFEQRPFFVFRRVALDNNGRRTGPEVTRSATGSIRSDAQPLRMPPVA
jgi:hypothetical protein